MIYYNIDKGKWNVSQDVREVSLEIEKGWCLHKDLDGDNKGVNFKLDGMEIYSNWKERTHLFTFPAEIQIYLNRDIEEISIVLDNDFLIYRSNEVPEFIGNNLVALFVYCVLEHEFQKLGTERLAAAGWDFKQNKAKIEKIRDRMAQQREKEESA